MTKWTILINIIIYGKRLPHAVLKYREKGMNRLARVYVFCCSNSFDKLELIRHNFKQNTEFKIIPLPCSGKLDILYLTKAFETGADGVAIMVCGKDECLFVEGNIRAIKRVEVVGKILEEIGVGKDRIAVIKKNDLVTEQAFNELEHFSLKIQNYLLDEKTAVRTKENVCLKAE